MGVKKRIRRKNPAELLLMGVNPHKRNPAELLLMGVNAHRRGKKNGGQRYAVQWHTGNISHAMLSQAEAEKLLAQFHGAGKIIRVNPMPLGGIESRSAVEAREIRSGFVAKPSSRYIVMDEPHMPAGDYAQLGKLYSLAVKPTPSGETSEVQEIGFEGQGILVVSDVSRRQIYFVGAPHAMRSGILNVFNASASDVVDLGECREIIYEAKKYHPEVGNAAAGKVVEWRHQFGEESGVVPHLLYDTKKNRFLLRGGEYVVEDAGIVN
jgi:hypothetical protein